MRNFEFVQLDVFSSRPLEGNPVAVFVDARGLTEGEMQAVAREMNLSETTFILPRDPVVETARGVRVRIFTVMEELPFAGHPTLGTAAVLRSRRTLSGGLQPAEDDEIRLELGVGTIPVRFRDDSEGTFGEMRQRDPEFGSIHDREALAQIAGLKLDDISTDLAIQTVSTGLPFAIVPVRSIDAMRRLRLDQGRADEYARRSDARFFYFVCRETVDPAARLHARMLFYNGEDPATGSAAGCCAAWAIAHGISRPDETVLIEQGVEMQRLSRIFVRAGSQGGRIANVRVGGYSVQVARGEVML